MWTVAGSEGYYTYEVHQLPQNRVLAVNVPFLSFEESVWSAAFKRITPATRGGTCTYHLLQNAVHAEFRMHDCVFCGEHRAEHVHPLQHKAFAQGSTSGVLCGREKF